MSPAATATPPDPDADTLLRRSPPSDLEAERACLGSVILDPSTITGFGALTPDDFYLESNGMVFSALLDLHRRAVAIDHFTLATLLRDQGKLEACGGVREVSGLTEVVASSSNAVHYATRVRDAARLRRAIQSVTRARDELFDARKPAAERLASLARVVGTVARPDVAPRQNQHPVPVIEVGAATKDLGDAAEEALLAREAPIFQRGGQLVRVRRAPEGGATVESLPAASLAEALAEHVTWTKRVRRNHTEHVLPPDAVVQALLCRSSWRLRDLRAFSEAPCLGPDGRAVLRDGWDPSGVFLALDSTRAYPPVPDRPTRDQAIAALARLAVPFSEFPWRHLSDMSGALALVLTLVARPAIKGPTPMFLATAPAASSGKGKILATASACALGRGVASSPPADDKAEERKALFSLGLEGSPFAVLDNLEHSLGSGVLAAALTADPFKDRLMHSQRTASVRLPVLAATGNNLQLKGDMVRRVVPLEIDPKTERPESRTFARELPAWAIDRHPELVCDALTALRGFLAAGAPAHGKPRMASFESWDSLVRSTIIWCGADDPLANVDRLRETAHEATGTHAAFMRAWSVAFGEPVTSAQALRHAEADRPFRDSLEAFCKASFHKIHAQKITWALKAVRDRIVSGQRFVVQIVDGDTMLWSVAK